MANKKKNVSTQYFKVTRQCYDAMNLLNELVKEKKFIESQDLLRAIVGIEDTGAGYGLGKYSITKTKIEQEIKSAKVVDVREMPDAANVEFEFRAKQVVSEKIASQPVQFLTEAVADEIIQYLNYPVSKDVFAAFEFAEELRRQMDANRGIDTYWLLVAMTQNTECNAYHIVNKLTIKYGQNYHGKRLHDEYEIRYGSFWDRKDGRAQEKAEEVERTDNRMSNKLKNASYSLIEDIAIDVTALARNGQLPVVIGREDEIKQIELVISRRNKNNVALIGSGGVGKSAIVEGLALKIVNGDIPSLANKRILQISLIDMHSKDTTVFNAEIVSKLIDDMKKEKDVILFIDEIHMLGKHKSLTDALKPVMARGDFRIIGATTPEEWESYMSNDSALVRRFERIAVEEPSLEDTATIVAEAIHAYENYHHVSIPANVIESSVYLADKYLKKEKRPDSVFTLIDNACAICKLEAGQHFGIDDEYIQSMNELQQSLNEAKKIEFNDEEVDRLYQQIDELRVQYEIKRNNEGEATYELQLTKDHLKEAVEFKSKKEVTAIDLLDQAERKAQELSNLKNLIDHMKQKVIGQDAAVEAVAKSVIRNVTGFRDHTKPAGVFLFLGTTGVGKTETAKVLAESLYGDDEGFLRIDMSEFQQPHEVSKLIGAPPGYAGFGKGGILTNAVKNHPQSVILLDEVEKAHQKVFDILLQVFDDARLTDSSGQTVDYSKAIIIMTSNLGASELRHASPLGFGSNQPSELDKLAVERKTREAAEEFFRPELLNRIDEIVTFTPFGREEIFKITKLLLDKEIEVIESAGYTAHFDETAVQYIADTCYDPKNGARPIKRGISKTIQDHLSDLLINGELHQGDIIQVTANHDALQFTIQPEKMAG